MVDGNHEECIITTPSYLDTYDEITILHLSDLHFGIENDFTVDGVRRQFRQKGLLKKLINTLGNDADVPPDWKPDVIVISGDIAWRGDSKEYKIYKQEFLAPLKEVLGLSDDRIITCPGNHDLIRSSAEGFERPYIGQMQLQVKPITRESISSKRKKHFKNYVNELCGGDPNKLCYSLILPQWPWLRFLIMNSAWDCRDDEDEGTLRIGLDLLEEIAGENQDEEIVVSIFHHPHTEIADYDIGQARIIKRNWLHITEREPEHEGGLCLSLFLEQRSNYILSGHIHKETKPQHSQSARAIQLISGAAYSNDTPKYHCRLLKIRRRGEAVYRDIRCTLGDGDFPWEVTGPKDFRIFGIIQVREETKQKSQEELAQLLRRAESALQDVREMHASPSVIATLEELMRYFAQDSSIENKLNHGGVGEKIPTERLSESANPLKINGLG